MTIEELYAKYGKEYPGDYNASAQQAAKDLEHLAAPGEVREVMDIENGKRQNRSGAAYIPGQYIRSAYRKDTATRISEEKTHSPLRTIIVLVTIVAAVLVAYYLSQGLVELFR